MNYIIDTHVFLWSLFESNKLSKKTREIILDLDNSIHLSIISFWEISIKYNLGKIKLKNVLPDDLPKYAEQSGFETLNIKPDEVSSFYKLPRTLHKDPFDRLIIWQAIQNKMTLISKDTNFDDYIQLGLKFIW